MENKEKESVPLQDSFDEGSWNDAINLASKVVNCSEYVSDEIKCKLMKDIRNHFISHQSSVPLDKVEPLKSKVEYCEGEDDIAFDFHKAQEVEPLKEDEEKLKEYFKAYVRKDMFSTYDDAEFEFYMRRPSIEADYCHRVDLMMEGYKYALQSSPNIKKESETTC